jgi:hypothetical protein
MELPFLLSPQTSSRNNFMKGAYTVVFVIRSIHLTVSPSFLLTTLNSHTVQQPNDRMKPRTAFGLTAAGALTGGYIDAPLGKHPSSYHYYDDPSPLADTHFPSATPRPEDGSTFHHGDSLGNLSLRERNSVSHFGSPSKEQSPRSSRSPSFQTHGTSV